MTDKQKLLEEIREKLRTHQWDTSKYIVIESHIRRKEEHDAEF